jgi:subtilisin-like proprotein convertase family protein
VGATNNMALTSAGTALAWGDNRFGQLGDGSHTPRFLPGQVAGLDHVTAVSAGLFNSGVGVRAPASLGLHLNPTSGTVVAGDQTSTTISFTPSRGLVGQPVNLAVSGLPAGVTAAFSTTTPDSGATSVLTFSATQPGAGGTFHITVTGTAAGPGGPIVASATFDLTVTATCTVRNDTDVSIPDNGPVVSSPVSTDGCPPVLIRQATVTVHVVHPHVGDLVIFLIGPDGTGHLLKASDPKDATANLDQTYVVPLRTGTATGVGPPTPGQWTLRVQDVIPGNSGTIDNWTLTI